MFKTIMVFRCGAPTSAGGTCKSIVCQENSNCGWHTIISGEDAQCPVCMEDIYVRNCKKLQCGHNFHKKCLNKWKMEGNRSCPLCRESFDLPQFRVEIHIQPINGAEREFHEREFSNPGIRQYVMSRSNMINNDPDIRTELTVETEDIDSLRRILEEIGIELTQEEYNSLTRDSDGISEP